MLVVIPALGVLGIVLNLVLTQQMDRDAEFRVFFGSFAAVLAGLAIHLTWSLVAAANKLAGPESGRLVGTWICGLVMAVGRRRALILFGRTVGYYTSGSASCRRTTNIARPPLQLPALLAPCVTLLVLVHLVELLFSDGLSSLKRPYLPYTRPTWTRLPEDALRRLGCVLCSSFIIFAASCYYEK